jgi:hypothetical protein
MNTRNCECCHANYATGKAYGDHWCEWHDSSVETKGLCEFCNPNCEKWYVPQKFCHSVAKKELEDVIIKPMKNRLYHKLKFRYMLFLIDVESVLWSLMNAVRSRRMQLSVELKKTFNDQGIQTGGDKTPSGEAE